jgi:hypothetical protein
MADDAEIFERHFLYELWMLLETRKLVMGAQNEAFGRIVLNALIEAFCVHARGLVEFFEGQQRRPTDVPASNFTDRPFVYTRDNVVGDLCNKINKQIAHITYDRTVDPKKVINSADCEELYRRVIMEIERYYGCVKPEYRAVWPPIVRPPFNQPSGLMSGFTTGTDGVLIGSSVSSITRST